MFALNLHVLLDSAHCQNALRNLRPEIYLAVPSSQVQSKMISVLARQLERLRAGSSESHRTPNSEHRTGHVDRPGLKPFHHLESKLRARIRNTRLFQLSCNRRASRLPRTAFQPLRRSGKLCGCLSPGPHQRFSFNSLIPPSFQPWLRAVSRRFIYAVA